MPGEDSSFDSAFREATSDSLLPSGQGGMALCHGYLSR